MEYELDSLGYVLHVYFGCSTDNSIEYEGDVPADYETLEEWAENADIRAYRIYEGDLVIDNARLQELQNNYDDEHYDYRHVEHRELEPLENAIQVINNTVPYDTAEAEGKVVTLTSELKSQPTIKLTDIKPYDYNKIDLYANGKNILPNTAATQEIDGLSFRQNDDRSITLNGTGEGTLPSEYTQVDYIKSDGSETTNNTYINTNYYPNTNTKIVMDYKFESPSSGVTPIIGERYSSNYNEKFAIWVNATNGLTAINFGNYDSGYVNNTNSKVRNIVSNENANLYYNGTKVTNTTDRTFTSRVPMYIFGINTGSYCDTRKQVWELYSLKIYEGTELKRNFIPCYRNSDNEIGLYDLVNGVFYTNQGTGSFTYGAEVPEYIEYTLAGSSNNTSPFLVFKKDEDYYLNTILNFKFNMYNFDGTDKTEVYSDSGGAISFSEDEPVTQITLSVPTNVEFEDATIYPMMAYGSTEQEYEPYKYNKCTIDFSNLIQDGLFINDDVFPNNDIVPAGTTIDYILINGSEVTILVNGNEESLDAANLNLFEGFNTIYAIQDAYLDITYYLNKLKLEGTTTKNNGFSIDNEGNMTCNNATINGSAIVNGSKFSVDEEGNMICNDATMSNANIIDGNITMVSTSSNPTINLIDDSLTHLEHRIHGGGQFIGNSQNNNVYINMGLVGDYGYISLHDDYNYNMPNIELAGYGQINAKYMELGTSTIFLDGDDGSITCVSLTQTSKQESKKNFEPLKKALDIVNDTDIYKYNFDFEEDNDKKHIGFVIGDDFKYREEITSKDNDGAEIYSMVSVLWQAVKEQQKEIEELKKQLKGSEK